MNVDFTKYAWGLPWLILGTALTLAGCNSVDAGGPGNASFVATNPSSGGSASPGVTQVNAAAFSASLPSGDYKISPLDVLKVKVFQVKDLDTSVLPNQMVQAFRPCGADIHTRPFSDRFQS